MLPGVMAPYGRIEFQSRTIAESAPYIVVNDASSATAIAMFMSRYWKLPTADVVISVMGAAMAMGNRAVLVASEPFPLAATDFYQVLDTSDVPGGVVNILTGSHAELAPHLAGHMDVDAVWSFSSSPISGVIEREAAGNLKRTWVNNGHARDWARADAAGFLSAATEVRNIWVPYGE